MAGPFGMSMGGSNLFQHHLGSGAMQRSSHQQRNKNLRRLGAAAAAATAGAAGVQLYRTGRLAPLLPQRPAAKANQPLLQIPRELADVICGAFGEIVQVAILYPLDTIKVGCILWIPWFPAGCVVLCWPMQLYQPSILRIVSHACRAGQQLFVTELGSCSP